MTRGTLKPLIAPTIGLTIAYTQGKEKEKEKYPPASRLLFLPPPAVAATPRDVSLPFKCQCQ